MSATAAVTITLKETNDFAPQLFPLTGSVCRDSDSRGAGLAVTAVDEDFPPQAAPFTFEILDDLSINWTVMQVNGKETVSDKYSINGVKVTLLKSHRSPFSLFRHSCCSSSYHGTGGGRVCSSSAGVRLWQPST